MEKPREPLALRDPSPSRHLRRKERLERLDRALQQLAPHYHKVVTLARLEELPIKEVARRINRSPEATSMLLLRALQKLKEAFGDTESLSLPKRDSGEGGRD